MCRHIPFLTVVTIHSASGVKTISVAGNSYPRSQYYGGQRSQQDRQMPRFVTDTYMHGIALLVGSGVFVLAHKHDEGADAGEQRVVGSSVGLPC